MKHNNEEMLDSDSMRRADVQMFIDGTLDKCQILKDQDEMCQRRDRKLRESD